MRQYRQLTLEQRYVIETMIKAGHEQKAVAGLIGVHPTTIGRELQRNRGKHGYRHKQAHELAQARRQSKSKPLIDMETWSFVESLIREDWSPEQISGWLDKNLACSVSHERIYQYILADKRRGGDLYRHLRCQKQKRKRYGSYDRRGRIKDRVSIEQRPDIVERRCRLGDWELDTIIGKGQRQAVVSLTERRSGLSLIRRVENRTAKGVSQAIQWLLKPYRIWVHTLTADNGKEFADHQTIARQLKADFYFAHPYAAWERGTNENTNGLIRQYFPKGMDFSKISRKDEMYVMDRLNNRPRKRLGFKTPNEVFFGQSTNCT